MKAVMSHWGAGYNGAVTIETFQSTHLAMLLAKKHFGSVHLFTDTPSVELLKNLPWDGITVAFDGLDESRKRIFSLGKMVAIREASKMFGRFIHIDNDCFLWKRPNEKILSGGVFCLCDELMNENLINDSLASMFSGYSQKISAGVRWMPNMALCGGNSPLWVDYVDTALEIVFDPGLAPFWTGEPIIPYHKAILAEQWMLAAFMEKRREPINLFFPNEKSPKAKFCNITTDDAAAFGISHTAHLKKTPDIVHRIAQRLAQNPPDLEMRKAPSMPTLVQNFFEASKMYAKDGFKNATKEQHKARLDICQSCDFWNTEGYLGMGKCLKCGCSGLKLWVASSKCPVGKW